MRGGAFLSDARMSHSPASVSALRVLPRLPPEPVVRSGRRYAVQEELASGGMGVVYRVLDTSTGQLRALKRMKPETTTQPYLVEAFEREYQVLAGIDHPRIIRVFDYGVDDIGPFYAMELLEGQDLRNAAPIAFREACFLLRDVATSLALLHARRLIYRDLSPANVRRTPDGHCKLIDFGALASFGSSRVVVGTAPAIPPEALHAGLLDQRVDIYAFGALAYWTLTGRHAYPAQTIEELPAAWKIDPPPPSFLVEGIPKDLDALVLSLLSADPLARPASMAEVIARLNVIGELASEGGGDAERLAQSFLLSPRFVGRAGLLEELREHIVAATGGHGAALRIEAGAGMGRTRILEEIAVRAQIAGAVVVRVDASTYSNPQGTARALVVRVLDAVPDVAHACSRRHRAALVALGREVETRLSARSSFPPPLRAVPNPGTPSEPPESDPLSGGLDVWFADVSRAKPLVIEVDNVDDADDASVGLLVGLARLAPVCGLLLVVTERERREPKTSAGLLTLRSQCVRLTIAPLSPAETFELARSLFGDAPNLARLAEWLHGRTAGSPLHSVELLRQLVASQVVRHIDGIWALPAGRPDAGVSSALDDALLIRLGRLGAQARGLVECLGLQREAPTLALCRLLVDDPGDERSVLVLLDELARNDVLYVDQDGYRFSSTALRETLLGAMDDLRREQNHHRLGEAFAHLAGADDPALRIQAGWHLIHGGDELRGAGMIAKVTHSNLDLQKLIANLHLAGEPLEAALLVYKRHRRSVYARIPLLSSLAHAGFYEDRRWGDRYGDEALDACEDLCGLRSARTLRRFFGRWLGLVMGLLLAYGRFWLAPREDRGYPFRDLLRQLFGAVTTLTGTAALSLDVTRATRVADVIDVFSILPARLTPVGIYEFCRGLREIGLENQSVAYKQFDVLRHRFLDPRFYPSLPGDSRVLYVSGAEFARGSFAVFRSDHAALESAAALDATGLKLYAMIASQIRYLYYMNRGHFATAARHRDEVEMHAAHVGSAWQVETWEAASLIPVYTVLGDVDAMTRVKASLEELAKTVPSLRFYSRLAGYALMLVLGDSLEESLHAFSEEIASHPPRSFIGWATSKAFIARAYNQLGHHAEARALCAPALAFVTEADREYVSLFLWLDIEMANADAGLGEVDTALARIDACLARLRDSDHALAQGLLHEARARISWAAGRVEDYNLSRVHVEHWFRQTGTPALIAKCERLADLPTASTGFRPKVASVGDAVTDISLGRLEPEARTVHLAVVRRREGD